ncbi:MAG: helix-turn-helix transcriptional regulator [Christensenellaceae bacterium]
MPISYAPLWETLQSRNITTYALIKNGFSKGTLDRLKHDRAITTDTIANLCEILDCQPSDILTYIK